LFIDSTFRIVSSCIQVPSFNMSTSSQSSQPANVRVKQIPRLQPHGTTLEALAFDTCGRGLSRQVDGAENKPKDSQCPTYKEAEYKSGVKNIVRLQTDDC
jgi:hypothetical protein